MDTREIVAQILSRFLLQHGRHVPPSLSHSITFITRSKSDVGAGSGAQQAAANLPPESAAAPAHAYLLPDPSLPLSIASELKRLVQPPPPETDQQQQQQCVQQRAPGQRYQQQHQVAEIKLVIGPTATCNAARELFLEPDKPVTLLLDTALEADADPLAFTVTPSSSSISSYSFGGGRHRGPAAFSFDAAISTYAKLPPPASATTGSSNTLQSGGSRAQKHSVSSVDETSTAQRLAPHPAGARPQRSHSDREVQHSELKLQQSPIAEESIVNTKRSSRGTPQLQDEQPLLDANKTTESNPELYENNVADLLFLDEGSELRDTGPRHGPFLLQRAYSLDSFLELDYYSRCLCGASLPIEFVDLSAAAEALSRLPPQSSAAPHSSALQQPKPCLRVSPPGANTVVTIRSPIVIAPGACAGPNIQFEPSAAAAATSSASTFSASGPYASASASASTSSSSASAFCPSSPGASAAPKALTCDMRKGSDPHIRSSGEMLQANDATDGRNPRKISSTIPGVPVSPSLPSGVAKCSAAQPDKVLYSRGSETCIHTAKRSPRSAGRPQSAAGDPPAAEGLAAAAGVQRPSQVKPRGARIPRRRTADSSELGHAKRVFELIQWSDASKLRSGHSNDQSDRMLQNDSQNQSPLILSSEKRVPSFYRKYRSALRHLQQQQQQHLTLKLRGLLSLLLRFAPLEPVGNSPPPRPACDPASEARAQLKSTS